MVQGNRRLRAAGAAGLMLAVAAVAAPTASVGAASPAAAACKVTNVATNKSKVTLQEAVDAAKARQTLQVRGTCTGTTTIGKSLTIVGVASRATGKPVLAGTGIGRVLLIQPGATVSILNLTVRGGDIAGAGSYPDNAGGGIRNEGTLTLRNVVVSGNKADQGGAISTSGRLTLAGITRLSGNQAELGGGMDVDGTLATVTITLTDRARINGNTTTLYGGGIHAYKARVGMIGASRVDHNTAGTYAGGINLVQSNLRMAGTSQVDVNTASGTGGGVNLTNGAVTLTSKSRIHHNTGSYGGGINVSAGNANLKDKARVDHNKATNEGGGIHIANAATTLTLSGAAQVDHNTSTASGGGIELNPGNLVMNGTSSVHHNKGAYAGGIEQYHFDATVLTMTLNDKSAVYANANTDPGGVLGISTTGALTMNDQSVVRDHVSTTTKRVVEVYSYVSAQAASITMKNQSRIRDNDVAAGFGALTVYQGCGTPATSAGTSGRVVRNTPVNVKVQADCAG